MSCGTPVYFAQRSALKDHLKIFAKFYIKRSSFMNTGCVRILK